ncbi:hypothetical protein ABGB07_20695 [Micromonosporaceae bacterium B7E4]
MDPNALAVLAEAGAAAIVTAMATDAWNKVRTTTVSWFVGDSPSRRDAVAGDLEQARHAVVDAYLKENRELLRDIQNELKGELKARLRDDNERIPTLETLIDEIRQHVAPETSVSALSQSAVADRGSVIMQAGNDIIGVPTDRKFRR